MQFEIERVVYSVRAKTFSYERQVLIATSSRHRVVFVEGERDRILINGTEFTDRSIEDQFASEMFGDLTEKFPWECEELPARRIRREQLDQVIAAVIPLTRAR